MQIDTNKTYTMFRTDGTRMQVTNCIDLESHVRCSWDENGQQASKDLRKDVFVSWQDPQDMLVMAAYDPYTFHIMEHTEDMLEDTTYNDVDSDNRCEYCANMAYRQHRAFLREEALMQQD